MKILIINSSNRKNGNTKKILDLLENNLLKSAKEKDIPIEAEYLSVAEMNLSICRGCRLCFDMGEDKCPLKDGLLAIRDKMLKAEGIILASPVYVEDVNGIMKNWIDRMAFLCHRPNFFNKGAMLITTSGSGSTKHSLGTMKNALTSWGFVIAAQKTFRMGASMDMSKAESTYNDELRKLAGIFLDSLKKKESEKPTFSAYVIFRVQQKYWQKNKNSSFDYMYWENKGWIKTNCDYYTEHKKSSIISGVARFFSNIIGLFFI
jgi:multimeric flavodoxin WrbA